MFWIIFFTISRSPTGNKYNSKLIIYKYITMSTFMALKPQWLSRQERYLKNTLDKHIRQQHQLHCQRLRQTVASIYCENGCYESWHFILLQWNESLSTLSNYLKTEQIGHCILIWIQQHYKRMKINIWRKKETKRLAEGKKCPYVVS